jgi:hypothetical protein
MSNPDKTHWKALKRIWGYLKRFPEYGVFYSKEELLLLGYIDSSWADNLEKRQSTLGYIFFLGPKNPISWYSTLQKTIALSSTEAEYMALKEAGKEAIYLYNSLESIKNILQLNLKLPRPAIITDSKSAQDLAENAKFHKRTKHIDIAFHYIRELVAEKRVIITHCPSKENLADPFTKAIPREQFRDFISRLRLSKV